MKNRKKMMSSWDDKDSRSLDDRGKLKNRILKQLESGKNKLLLLERRITGGKKVQELLERARLSKMKIQKARVTFDKYEKMTEHYIEKNPKKAVLMALAAGVLAEKVWSSLRRDTTIVKKRPAPSMKRSPLKA